VAAFGFVLLLSSIVLALRRQTTVHGAEQQHPAWSLMLHNKIPLLAGLSIAALKHVFVMCNVELFELSQPGYASSFDAKT
jgi:hypothetical protein